MLHEEEKFTIYCTLIASRQYKANYWNHTLSLHDLRLHRANVRYRQMQGTLPVLSVCVCNAYHICFLRLQRIKYTSNAHSERKEAPCLLIVARAKNDFQLHLHILKMQHFSAKHLESDFKLITHLLHHFPGFFLQTEQLSFFSYFDF